MYIVLFCYYVYVCASATYPSLIKYGGRIYPRGPSRWIYPRATLCNTASVYIYFQLYATFNKLLVSLYIVLFCYYVYVCASATDPPSINGATRITSPSQPTTSGSIAQMRNSWRSINTSSFRAIRITSHSYTSCHVLLVALVFIIQYLQTFFSQVLLISTRKKL